MKRHQISIFTSGPGKTWASCSTCKRSSKQGTRASAEAWMLTHQNIAMGAVGAKAGAK